MRVFTSALPAFFAAAAAAPWPRPRAAPRPRPLCHRSDRARPYGQSPTKLQRSRAGGQQGTVDSREWLTLGCSAHPAPLRAAGGGTRRSITILLTKRVAPPVLITPQMRIVSSSELRE